MNRLKRGRAAMVLFASCCAFLPSTGAHAAVHNLRLATVRATDAPTGFSHPHVKVYRHFATDMTVSVLSAGASSPSTCSSPAAFKGIGWKQGLIQSFDSTKLSMGLRLCAYLFSTSSGAHQAYRLAVGAWVTPLISMKMGTALELPALGNEAAGVRQDFGECSCTTQKNTSMYDVAFRRANVVVNMSYTGPISLPVANFVRLVTGTDTKLR